jgi:hypothetical protein
MSVADGIDYRCGCRGVDGRKLGKDCPAYGKRGHGSFYPRISLTGPDGKRRQPTLGGFPTRTAAKHARDETLARLRGGFELDRRQTVGEWLEEWFAGKRNLRPGTRRSYRQHIDDYLIPHLGSLRLEQLRAAHVSTMIDCMLAGTERLHPGPSTVRRVHATLRSALNTAVKQQRLTMNPAVHVELPRVQRTRVHPWSASELGAFLDAASADRLAALFECMAMTGLRRGEALGLRWEDIDLERQVVTVVQQLIDTEASSSSAPRKPLVANIGRSIWTRGQPRLSSSGASVKPRNAIHGATRTTTADWSFVARMGVDCGLSTSRFHSRGSPEMLACPGSDCTTSVTDLRVSSSQPAYR